MSEPCVVRRGTGAGEEVKRHSGDVMLHNVLDKGWFIFTSRCGTMRRDELGGGSGMRRRCSSNDTSCSRFTRASSYVVVGAARLSRARNLARLSRARNLETLSHRRNPTRILRLTKSRESLASKGSISRDIFASTKSRDTRTSAVAAIKTRGPLGHGDAGSAAVAATSPQRRETPPIPVGC